MKWSVAYATGIATIDQQHQMLFQTSEDYRAALDLGEGERVYGLVLEFLESFAQSHFGYEEGCMARCGCSVAGQNAAAHRKFIDRLKDFKRLHEQRMRYLTDLPMDAQTEVVVLRSTIDRRPTAVTVYGLRLRV